MPVFTTPEPIYVTIELSMGDVRIIASDRTDTVIEVRPRDDSKASDIKAAEQTQVEYSSGRLLVKSRQRNFIYEGARSVIGPGRGSPVDVTIELPTGSQVQGDSGMGDFGCEGHLGECRFKTGMGNIRLDHTSALHLKTGMGNIAVDRASGDADVTTGSGEVRIGYIGGAAVIKNSNGDTAVGEVIGDLRVKSANGRISVDRAHAFVIAKTANGNIRIGEVMRGAIVLETAAGELEVGIREGTAAWLDVSSQYGRVRNSLDETGSPEQSEATVEIQARTSVGDIKIHRANQSIQTGNK
jgi:Putative adhesin